MNRIDDPRTSRPASPGRLLAAGLVALACFAVTSAGRADEAVSIGLDRVVPLSLSPGDGLVVRGFVHTHHDGAQFDAASRTEGGVTNPGGLFDLAAGGLRVADVDSVGHVVKLAVTGEDAPGCRAAGVSPPCLVPRTEVLAHDRLLSLEEFRRTLSGSLSIEELRRPAPLVTPGMVRVGTAVAAWMLAGLSTIAILIWALSRKRSPLVQVRAAEKHARAVATGDATLVPVRAEIDGLVARAVELEAARKACERRLRKIDRAALESGKRAWAGSSAPEAGEVYRWLAAEASEADKLARDHDAAIAGLQQIAASLRVIALSGRTHRDLRLSGPENPLDAVSRELAIRDRALSEAQAAE